MAKAKKRPKAKTKTRRAGQDAADNHGDERFASEKAAIRSEAFAKAILDAKSCSEDPDQLKQLYLEAARKTASLPREPFRDTWAYLQTMLRLVRAYQQGEYRLIPKESLLTVIAALNYLVDPFDLIPDEVPFLGFLDDATVISYAAGYAREALDDFMTWETTAP